MNLTCNLEHLTKQDLDELIREQQERDFEILEPKERAFVFEYLDSYNHRLAAERVGYNPDKALSILRNPMIAAAIRWEQEKSKVSMLIDKEFIVRQYLRMIPKLHGDEPFMSVNRAGEQVYGQQFLPSELRQTLGELQKLVPEFKNDQAPVGGNALNITIDVQKLVGSDAATIEIVPRGTDPEADE